MKMHMLIQHFYECMPIYIAGDGGGGGGRRGVTYRDAGS